MNNLDLIKQYVNTGVPIGDYQLNKLPKNILNSYLRKRLQGEGRGSWLTDTEFILAPLEFKKNYAIKKINDGFKITDKQFNSLTPELKDEYNKTLRNYTFSLINKLAYDDVTRVQQSATINLNDLKYSLRDYHYNSLTPEEQRDYSVPRAKSSTIIHDYEFNVLTPEEKIEYLYVKLNKKKRHISGEEADWLGNNVDLMVRYMEKKKEGNLANE